MNTNAPRKTADEIATLFVSRLPVSGGWLTRNQTSWLFNAVTDERGNGVRPRSAAGLLTDGRGWDAHVSPNGCANLKLSPKIDLAAAHAEYARDLALRAINDRVAELFFAGKHDEARALLETEAVPLMAAAPAPSGTARI